MWLSDLQITACRFKTEWWKGDLWVHPTHPSSVIVPKHVLQVVLDKIFAKSRQMQCNTCELWHKKPPTWIVVIIQHSCYNSGGITSSLCLRADPQANQKKALWDVKNIEPLIWPPIGCIFYVACHKSICRMKSGVFYAAISGHWHAVSCLPQFCISPRQPFRKACVPTLSFVVLWRLHPCRSCSHAVSVTGQCNAKGSMYF